MMKQEFWNKVKAAAEVPQTLEIRAIDSLLAKYHQTPKSDTIMRHSIARNIIERAVPALQKVGVDGAYAAAGIIQVSAQDTMKRLDCDMEVIRARRESGMKGKALAPQHRHERLDPQHSKWGILSKEQFQPYRKKWHEELLGIAATKPAAGQLAVSSFYDFLAGNPPSEAPVPTKYYTPLERESKRIVIAKPGSNMNDSKKVKVMRMAKQSNGGTFRNYDSNSSWRTFIMDGEKHFYACTAELKDGKMKHHSSLADGSCILGAGQMMVRNGKITRISQQSGHYLPDPEQMLNVLRTLEQSGVDLTSVTMDAYTYFNDPKKQQPDGKKPGHPFPKEQTVNAAYYLKTAGKWATDPKFFAASPDYVKSTQMLGEIITDPKLRNQVLGIQPQVNVERDQPATEVSPDRSNSGYEIAPDVDDEPPARMRSSLTSSDAYRSKEASQAAYFNHEFEAADSDYKD